MVLQREAGKVFSSWKMRINKTEVVAFQAVFPLHKNITLLIFPFRMISLARINDYVALFNND